MSAKIWEEQLLIHVNNNLNYMLQNPSVHSQDCVTPALDYASVYANMKDYNDCQSVFVALGKAIQLWRFMSSHEHLDYPPSMQQLPLNFLNEGDSLLYNYSEDAEVTPNWNAIVSPYIATKAQQLAPIRPLLSQKSHPGNLANAQQSAKNKRRPNLHLNNINQINTTSFDHESNVIYKLFKSLHLLYIYIEDKLPIPHDEADLENPACFQPTMNIESMLFGKLFAGPQPATFCLQTLIRRMFFKVKAFLGNLQLITNKLKLKDRKLYMQSELILNKLQYNIELMGFYTETRFNFKHGVFLSSDLYLFAEVLVKVLENLIETVREANIYVHLFNWEMAHREKYSGAFYTQSEQDAIISNYLAQENEAEILNNLFEYKANPKLEEEEVSIAKDANEEKIYKENESYAVNSLMICFDVKGFHEITTSTALFNSTRRHAA